MKIDTHVHFWRYNAEEFKWVADPKIQKDFLPREFERIAGLEGYDGCINVQARFKYEENDFMLGMARHNDFIKGVVGWVSLTDDQLGKKMQDLSKNPKFVGVRDFIDGCLDAGGRIRQGFAEGFKIIGEYDKVFELVINEDRLPDAIILAGEFPGLTFVIDHMAKPRIKDKVIEPWATNMMEISKLGNVYCKVSGIATEADLTGWEEDDFKPYLDIVFEAFGASRLMIGSDWPVCLRAGNYGRVAGIVENYIRHRSDDEKAAISGGNAVRVYRLR